MLPSPVELNPDHAGAAATTARIAGLRLFWPVRERNFERRGAGIGASAASAARHSVLGPLLQSLRAAVEVHGRGYDAGYAPSLKVQRQAVRSFDTLADVREASQPLRSPSCNARLTVCSLRQKSTSTKG